MSARVDEADPAVTQSVVSGDEGPVRFASVDDGLEPDFGVTALDVGRYLAIEEVGRGSMGVVLRAYDPRLLREVALKRVRSEALSAESQARLFREAQAMAKLSHPNVVAVYDIDTIADSIVIAMEYVRGESLKSWLTKTHPWRAVVRSFAAAGRGLAAAHAVGLLHRDFKPANVLVGEDGRVRVTDFGLASSSEFSTADLVEPGSGMSFAGAALAPDDALTQTGILLGTPRYMAPEQHDVLTLSPASDQYAFCVALWEGLTGQPPFPVTDMQMAVAAKRAGPPPWPRETPVPAPLRKAIARGLAPNPAERWPSMEVLLALLDDHVKERRRAWGFAGGMVAVAGVSSVAWGAHRQQAAERCSGAAAQLASIWDGDRRDVVEQSLMGTDVIYAAEVWERVGPQLDDYARAWSAMHTDACLATTVREEQPIEVMDLRMACLHRAKVELRAVTDLLTRSDAQVVEKIHAVVGSLPALERCADVEALRAEVAPPEPREAEAVEAIRVELAEIRALYEAAKYPEMLERIRPLAERAQEVPYAPLQTEVKLVLGQAWDKAAAYPEATAAYKEALRNALALKQWRLAQASATALAHAVGREQTRPSEGLAYVETAAGLLPRSDLAAQAVLHDTRGSVLERMGRWAESEAEHRAAVALAEQAWGPQAVETASYRGNLGGNLVFQGRFTEAEQEQRAQLRLREAALGSQHPSVASARFDLGYTYYLQGRYAEAETEERAAVESWTRTLGEDHANTALARATLAYALAAQGREVEAEAEYQKALRVQLRLYGPDHLEVAFTAGSLAKTLTNLGRYAEAEVQARDSLRIVERTYGPEHPHIISARRLLIMVLLPQGRFAEAEEQAGLGLATVKKLVGYQHLDVPLTYANLGAALNGQGQYVEAEGLLKTGLEIMEALPEHPYRARIHNGLGETFAGLGRLDDAEAEHRKALDLQLRLLDAEHPGVAETRLHLGSVLRKLGRYDDAETELREALTVQERRLVKQHPDLARTESELGWTLLESGRVREAQIVLERAWAAWRADERVLVPVRAELAAGLGRALAGTEPARARELAATAALVLRTPNRGAPR